MENSSQPTQNLPVKTKIGCQQTDGNNNYVEVQNGN